MLQVVTNGVVREYWNDSAAAVPNAPHANIPARSVRYYDAAGAPTSTRAFTPAENAAADAAATAATQAANAAAIDTALANALASLQAIIADGAASANDKTLAQVLRRVIRVLRRDFGASS